ncbi:MAG: WD40 repeat domain-containing protein [Candidatus Kapabacteria bacterium]|nr:WD40 repeat domain-containing protein [Candidatus Kapabacteria bacterium]
MKSKLIVYLFLIISLSLYSPNSALSKLKLLYPNGSEKISYDKPIDIIWEGVDSSESVTIEFSWNNGTSWNLISNDAKGLRYNWSNIPFENSKDCLIRLRSNIFWDSTNTNFNEIAYQKQGTFNILGWEQESSKLITLSQVTNSTLSHFDTSSKKLNVIKNNLEYYADCTISPDNKKIIGVNTFGRYGIYDAITGATICSFNSKLNSKYNIAGNFFAWSPDCKYVAIAATIYDDNKVIYIHKTDTGELFDSLKPDFNAKFHGFNLLQLSWSNDNKFIRFATSSSVYTWSTNFVFISEESFYALLKNYNEADNWDVRISPDGKYVGLIDYKNTLSIYDLIEKKMKKILNLKNISKNAFTSFRWNHLSNRISFFSRDSVTNLDIYDLDKDTVYIDSPLISTINDIVWSTTGVSLKNFEEKWGKGTKILTFNIDSLNDNCSSYPNIRYSPNGKYIAFLGLNRQYKIINSNDGELVLSIYANPLTYKSNYYTSNDFAWHPDNDKIIINADSGNLDIYSISQRKRIKRIANIYTFFPTLPAAKYYVPTLFEFSSDGKYILAGFDEAIIVIDFETGKLVKSILNSPNLARSIYNLKWDYEHNHLAVSYYDNNIHKYFIEVMEFDMNKNQGTEFNGPLYTRLLKQQVDKNFYSLCNYYFLPDGGFIYKTLESITKYDKNFKKISSILLDNNDKFPIENQLSTDFNLMISSLRFDN